MNQSDTEALKALVAKWRKQAYSLGTENPDFSDGLSASRDECADDLEAALERLLASQGEQREAQEPRAWEIQDRDGNWSLCRCSQPWKPVLIKEDKPSD